MSFFLGRCIAAVQGRTKIINATKAYPAPQLRRQNTHREFSHSTTGQQHGPMIEPGSSCGGASAEPYPACAAPAQVRSASPEGAGYARDASDEKQGSRVIESRAAR